MKVNRIANWINNSKKAQAILKNINDNPAMYSAVSSFALAAVFRPGLIGVMPFKEKKDKQYSQASAVAAGIVELGASAALFVPLNKCIAKASENLYKSTGTFYEKNPAALRQFKGEERPTDIVDEVLLKAIDAPTKKVRGKSREER